MSKPAAPPGLIAKIRSTQQRLKSQSHYERLGVDRSAGLQDVRRAYNDAASEWHPDRHNKWDLGADEANLTNLFAMLTEAQTVLTNKKRREEYDAELSLTGSGTSGRSKPRLDAAALFEADAAFRIGQQLLNSGKVDAARLRFQEAFDKNPNSTEFRVYFAFTEYLLLPRDPKGRPVNQKAVSIARDEINAAIETLPEFDHGHFMLGKISLDNGEPGKAKREFQQALHINSKNVQAMRQLRLLNMRGGGGSSEPGAFMNKLKSLFKRK